MNVKLVEGMELKTSEDSQPAATNITGEKADLTEVSSKSDGIHSS